jgi:hypothetical protein
MDRIGGTAMYSPIVAFSLICAIPAIPQDPHNHFPYSYVSQEEPYTSSLKEFLLSVKADSSTVQRLFSEGMIVEEDEDQILRPKYVSLQAAFEQLLSRELDLGRLKQVVAVIHTPLPATPLCTEGEVTQDLVDPAILKDEKRLQTVSKRPAILRSFLESGGTLVATYPALSRTKRTPAQLAVFESLLTKYKKNLFDMPMRCLDVVPQMVGATYLFETAQGEWLTFSIKFQQAIAPNSPTSAGLWFGSVNKGPAAERLAQVSTYLLACQGPDLFSYIHK